MLHSSLIFEGIIHTYEATNTFHTYEATNNLGSFFTCFIGCDFSCLVLFMGGGNCSTAFLETAMLQHDSRDVWRTTILVIGIVVVGFETKKIYRMRRSQIVLL